MAKGVSVIDQIFSCYHELFEAEKRVADYILAQPEQVIDMTVSELAELSAASNATIIRFCKKCGCQGFQHLKIRIARESAVVQEKQPSGTIHMDDLEQSLHNIVVNKCEEIKQTLYNIPLEEVRTMVDRIKESRFVLFAALGNTIPVALDGAYKLNQLGITALCSPIWESQMAMAHTLTAEDVVIAISASGESKKLLTLVDRAQERGAAVLAITNYAKSSLALRCPYHIHTVARERLFFPNFSFAFTRLAAMAVMETFFFLLASSKAGAQECIALHEQTIADDKT
ncbi:MurR/RpiR family transcriptional regulator [Propionispora hippei]|uniref:Transcriptional regulator, RpiR family n=1 Tax=Propionispora hippei DSM 15287 TaxID=1123003 RepID=A0A1M6I6D7_9FIRM|nr:MurR/RpiR family transcriptional regulator [Propionispora hippei]SHJ29964.1 transcriptional regulator, RpiR family [Propionispora hippei DSM 15287]